MYRLPKYVSSGFGGSRNNFSLAECKDEEDASRKKEVDDLISKYAPKNVDKNLEQQVGLAIKDMRRQAASRQEMPLIISYHSWVPE